MKNAYQCQMASEQRVDALCQPQASWFCACAHPAAGLIPDFLTGGGFQQGLFHTQATSYKNYSLTPWYHSSYECLLLLQ